MRADEAPALALQRTTRRLALSETLVRAEVSRHAFSLAGIPLRGAFETVYTDRSGRQRVVAARRPEGMPQFLPEDARIGPETLPQRIATELGLPAPPELEAPPRLVYLLVLGQPILCWESQLALVLSPEPSRKTVWVSAMTGRVLAEREQVQSARARVFAENPSKTPEPIEVELSGLATAGAGAVLEGERVTSFNCTATPSRDVPPWWEEGECYPVHSVVSDDKGDFFVPLPNVVIEADNEDPEDAYAELSMYYHAERFLDEMAARGIEEFQCERATMLANVRKLEPSASSHYTPLNNAYFTNQCDPEKGATMLFGQGSDVDFSYDGDVVYHELGHGMVALLTPEGLGGRALREDGSSSDAGGLNEAIADYFAFTITEDGRLAEYVGRFWAGTSGSEIRTAANQKRCPDDIVSQVHNDGEPVMAALWAARSRLGLVVDAIVVGGLVRLPPDATLEQAAAVFLEVAEALKDAGEIDDEGLAIVERSLAARGLSDCRRVIVDPGAAASGRSMYLRRVTAGIQPFYPGPMQLRGVVPPGKTALEVRMSLRSSSDGIDPTVVVLVKRADQPITFGYDLVAAPDPGDPSGQTGKVREVILVGGDWDLEIEPRVDADGRYTATIGGLHPGDVVHVSVAATSTADVVASGVSLGPPGATPASDPDDHEPEAHTGGRQEVVPGEAVTSGCGCGAPGDAERHRWLVAWCALPWFRRRRP